MPTVALSAATLSVGEAAGTATLNVLLSAASPVTVTVNYATSNGTATAGSDYSATSGTLTFAPGVSSLPISMPILNDLSDEPNETLTLTLSAPAGARLATPSAATITITDDDATPTVAWQAASVSVGEASVSALVTAVLSNPSASTVTVNYATSNGSATAGSDYTAKSGTFSFAPGVTSQSTSITILNDALTEPNETVTLTLSAPANATLGNPNPATLTILDDETAPPPSDSYETYDALGNLIKHGLTNYGYGANGNGTGAEPHQARTVGGQAYTYDANGNLLTGGGRSFTWDHENRPSQIVNGALTETYAYDADGERISRTSAGTTTVYLGGIWEETTAGNVKQYYTLHSATVAVRDSSTGVASLHADHLGSLSVASGAGATLLSRQAFGPWGTVASGGVSQTALNVTGQRLDSGTGLLYYHARYYDPALARFVSADTIVPGQADKAGTPNPQHLNRYTYGLNNPVKHTDPTGHFAWMLVGFAVGAGIDLASQLYSNGGDISKVNVTQTLVSGAVGAIGVGTGGLIAKAGLTLGKAILANAAVSGIVSGVGAAVQNALQDPALPKADIATAAGVGALTGGVGAAVGAAANGMTKALANARYERLTLAEKLFLNSNAVIRDTNARSRYDYLYAAGNALSIAASNAGPAVPVTPQSSSR